MTTIQEAIDTFLTNREWAANTRATYEAALRKFAAYLEEHEHIAPDRPTLRLSDVVIPDRYAEFLAPRRDDDHPDDEPAEMLNERTYRLLLVALTGFYRYLFKEDLVRVSATRFQQLLERLRDHRNASIDTVYLAPERERMLPHRDVVERIIEIAATDVPPWKDPEKISDGEKRRFDLRCLRNVAILEMLRCTGVRVSEAVGLKRGDLSLSERTVHIPKEVAKGKKARTVYVDRRAATALKAYFLQTGGLARDLPLFLQHSRAAGSAPRAMKPAGVQRQIRRLRARLVESIQEDVVRLLILDVTDEVLGSWVRAFDGSGLPSELLEVLQRRPDLVEDVDRLAQLLAQAEDLSAHSFRHYVASELVKTGDMAATQDLMGHASMDTTRIYAELDDEHRRRVHEEVFGE